MLISNNTLRQHWAILEQPRSVFTDTPSGYHLKHLL